MSEDLAAVVCIRSENLPCWEKGPITLFPSAESTENQLQLNHWANLGTHYYRKVYANMYRSQKFSFKQTQRFSILID